MIEPKYVNPTRRDLLKQLFALGVVGITSPITAAKTLLEEPPETPSIEGTWKSDSGYETLRTSMYASGRVPERYPDVIFQPTQESEIFEILEFAKNNDLQIVCRTSGHNTAGAVLRNGGLLMDLSELNGISVNKAAKTATIQPGARFEDFYAELQKNDLGFPVGDCATVTFGGYILGGGLGKNGNNYTKGPACYAVQSADVILADGEKITATENQNADIFWSIRGCGPGFYGIVTSYTIQLFDPLGAIVSNSYTFEEEDLPRVIQFFEDRLDKQDDRVGTSVGLADDRENPGRMLVTASISATTLKGSNAVEEAKALLQYYIDEGIGEGAIAKSENRMTDLNDMFFTYPPGFRTNTDNIYTNDTSALMALVDHFKNKPPMFGSVGMTMNSQIHPHREDGCWSPQGRHFVSYHANWFDEAIDVDIDAWLKEAEAILKPFGLSHYINQTDNATFPDHIQQCFTEENWNRLVSLRKKHDPENRFFSYLGHS